MTDTVTLGNLLGSLSVIATIVAFMMHLRKVRRENDADARSRTEELKAEIRLHNDSVEKRLTAQETKSADFMPRSEIETKIEHEKGNRQAADHALELRVAANTRDIVEMRVSIGRLEQKQDGMANDMGELKTLVRDFAREVNAKLDKQQECLNSLSRKAG